ncbi:DUF3147 family protein [Brevibacillus sp. H7]|jgi:hypothetical protein|uniref:DUF3147 family protein n=1 Tax=Brevibacillus sp. H7 TaxID=3349138 RepID=UPI0038124282
MFFLIKILTSALVIGIVTEVARRLPTAGGVIAALPIVSLLSLIWLNAQGESHLELSQFAKGVLWGFPATAVLLWIVSAGLRHSFSLFSSILLGVMGWGALFLVQDFLFKKMG